MNRKLIIAVAFPIVCLAALTAFKAVKVNSGRTIVLPISGFDPRNMLSGHYLTYQVEYGGEVCSGNDADSGREVLLCVRLQDGKVSSSRTNRIDEPGCDAVLSGRCDFKLFNAGIVRYYIPEQHSKELDSIVRDHRAKILVAVDRNGKAMVKDLLIDDSPLGEHLKNL
ncbi:MAG: GDYXXLXY domain-containing protein [Myxococcota bacterium]|jgi:uncharacterized membrane-anchored protein